MERKLSILALLVTPVLLVSICKPTCFLFRECNLDLPQCRKRKEKLAGSHA